MDQLKLQEILQTGMRTAASETLENMAFMEVLTDMENTEHNMPGEVTGVSLLIHDPIQWELKLYMPKALLCKIAEALYALPEEDLTEEQLNDLEAEILNTIAGRFLSEVLPQDQTFTLGLPENGLTDYQESDSPLMKWAYIADREIFSLKAIGASFDSLQKLYPTDK